MKTKFIVALLVASSGLLTAPAFASGYGPAPFYRPDVGAPASQSGQSAQTLAVEASQGRMVDESRNGVGGDDSGAWQSGRHAPADPVESLYFGR